MGSVHLPATASASERLHALDLLRFLAAFSVLGYHWNWVTPDETRHLLIYPEQWFRYGGMLGIICFFIISGFVILRSARNSSPLRFVTARAIRLYPAFWVCCTLTFLLTDPWLHTWRNFLVNLTMFPEPLGAIPIDEAYWTLVLEARFYFLIWLLLALRSLKHMEVFLWSWLIHAQLPDLIIFREWVAASGSLQPFAAALFDLDNGGRNISTYAAFFIGGCACCLLGERQSASRWLLLVAAVVAGGLESAELARRAAALYQFRPVGVVVSVTVGFFLCILAIAMGWIRLPASRTLWALGAVSYPLYLLHMYIGSLMLSGLAGSMPFPLLYFLNMAGVLGLSWCVVVYAEAPMQAWLRARLGKTGTQTASGT